MALLTIILQLILCFTTCVVGQVAGGEPALNSTGNDCRNAQKDVKPECWSTLRIDEYLRDWWGKNSQTCLTDVDYKGDGFASCYQQLHKVTNQQCDEIGSSSCLLPTDFSERDPREFYVLYSIYGVWQWLNSIFTASNFANGIANERIGKIVSTISPVKNDRAAGMALSVLAAGLAFIDLPAAGIVDGTVGKGLTTFFQQMPGVVTALRTPQTVAGQFTSTTDIQNTLANVVTGFHTMFWRRCFKMFSQTSTISWHLLLMGRSWFAMDLSPLPQIPSLNY